MADLRKNYETGIDAGLIQLDNMKEDKSRPFYGIEQRKAFAQGLKDKGII